MDGETEMLIAICDPDPNCIKKLVGYVSLWFNTNKRSCLIRTYSDLYSFILHVSYFGEPDVIIYRIYEGIERQNNLLLLRKVCPEAEIIIASDKEHHAVWGYRIRAAWFLTLPYNPVEIRESLERCADHLSQKYKHTFCIESEGKMVSVRYEYIEYFESIKHYIFFSTTEGKSYHFRENISSLCTYLPASLFLRCHKCYIVNLARIETLSSTVILLNSGKEIPLSRNYRDAIQGAFQRYARPFKNQEEGY